MSSQTTHLCVGVRGRGDIEVSERVLSKDAHICVFSNDSSTCGCEREGRDVEVSERVLSKDAIYVCVSERCRGVRTCSVERRHICVCVREKEDIDLSERVLSKDTHVYVRV